MTPTNTRTSTVPVDIPAEVHARILTLTRLIPSISPFNVWDLPWSMWLAYAAMVDAYTDEQRKAALTHG